MRQFVSDIDEILREEKKPISREMQESLNRYGQEGIFITGAPLSHVPQELFMLQAATILAEHGAVKWRRGQNNVVSGARDIEIIRKKLGISINDGFQEMDEHCSVIIEGPRTSSLTFLFGAPPHYPFCATANRESIKDKIQDIIQEDGLSVSIYQGEDKVYTWLDLITSTKKDAIQQLIIDGTLSAPFFYIGDKENDLEVMQLEEVVPVAFPNCICDIISLARQRGIYIDCLPYEGGVSKFFAQINGKP
ncbi:MAG: hypothetical protein ABIB55_00710 [Candidatus Nealsonbacteria bacterium]